MAVTFFLGSSSTTQFHPRTLKERVLVAMIPIYFCTTKQKNSHNFYLGCFPTLKFQVIERLIGKQAFKGCSFPLEKAVPLER